jgi:fused signal recognition particle receptor
MRRWFRKKDRKPHDLDSDTLSPREEAAPTADIPGEEAAPLAPETQAEDSAAPAPQPDVSAEAVSGAEEPGAGCPGADAAPAKPRRRFLGRLFHKGAVAEEGLAGEAAAPDMELQLLTPEELPELTEAAGEGAIIDLEEEIREEEPEVVKTRKRRFSRFRERLGRTRKSLAGGLERLFLGRREVDAEVLDELEEMLITADLGVDTTLRLVEVIRDKVERRELSNAQRLKEALRLEMVQILSGSPAPERTSRPWVILMVGVNGVGKTTTIAKLAHQDRARGLNPLLVAADTFRAAAVEQLEIWGERVGAQVVRQNTGSDPAAVVFDGLDAAQARGVDVVYVDTAGRLHTKVNLMEELKKIHRTVVKKMPGAPHEILLVLDATTGQNALNQARLFHEAVGVTGVVLTKLDGTAKGGMALAVAHETGLPLRYVGVGEGMDDLQPFDPEAFVAAIID